MGGADDGEYASGRAGCACQETTAVVLDGVSGEIEVRRITGRPEQVLTWLETLERPFQAVYEAGPTGYGLTIRTFLGLFLAPFGPRSCIMAPRFGPTHWPRGLYLGVAF